MVTALGCPLKDSTAGHSFHSNGSVHCRTSLDHAILEAEKWGWFGAESGYFVTTSFQFLGDRSKHIPVHTNATQLRHLNLLCYRRLGKQV